MTTLSFTTQSGPKEAAFAAYHDLYAPVADVARLGGEFAVEVDAHRLGQMLFFDRRVRSVRHSRSPQRVARNAFDHFTAQVALDGAMNVSTENGDVRVDSGCMVFIDMSRTMTTEAVSSRNLTLSIPRTLMEAADVDIPRLHGAMLAPRQAGLLRDFLESYADHADGLNPQDPSRIEQVVKHLLAVTLEGRSRARAGREDAVDLLTRHRARKFIELNLRADPASVANAIGRSRSALYRAFEPHGGVARYIQARRVARLRHLLGRPAEAQSISALGKLCGFQSESHCSRAFKATYGLSPKEFRALGGPEKTGADAQLPGMRRQLGHWWAEMR